MTHFSDFTTLALLLGCTQGLFLALLLINKPVNKTANRILASLMIAYSSFIIYVTSEITQIYLEYPHLYGITKGVTFLFGPLHYLYALSLISQKFNFSRKYFYHVIPFIAFYLYFLFPFYLQSGTEKLHFLQMIETKGPTPGLIFFSWFIVFHGLSYMIATLSILKKHQLRIKDNFSTVDKINLKWLRNITGLTLIIWITGLIVEILQLFNYTTPFTISVPLTIAILIYTMGYLGLKQSEIFSGNHKSAESAKYQRSGLSADKAQKLNKKLIQIMDSEKPFIDSNLKLNQLAKILATTPNHLSQVINEEQKQNFFDFINKYRIEESKKLICNTSHKFTLLAIAYDVGFNSKSAFNNSFKKHTGMTPSQFKKQFKSTA